MSIRPTLMRRLLSHTGWLLAGVILLAGCSGPRAATAPRPDLPGAFPNHSLAQILQAVQPQPDTLSAFTAKASLSIRSPQQDGNVNADVASRRGDSLSMRVSVPGLGIEAARMLVTPDSFFVYDRIKKKVMYGSVAYANQVLPVPVSGDDAFLSMLGLPAPDADVAWTVEVQDEFYHLSAPAQGLSYLIDPARWRVVRFEARTPDGEVLEQRVYSEFDLFGGLYLPRRIFFSRPQDDTRVSLYYRDLTLNPDDLSISWSVSDSADRVLIDETSDLR